MSGWVKGPATLTERMVDVYEGTVCVILRNGEVYDVRGPGRHGGFLRVLSEDRRLPVSGSLKVLTFERAPAVSQPVTTDVRLRDGSTVQVTTQAAIVPLWQKDPAAVKNVVQRYGVQPDRIEECAQLELEESLKVMATESLASLTHEQVHSRADARTLMRLPRPVGLLTVGHLVSCSITRDRHSEGALTAVRDAELDGLRGALEGRLAVLRAVNQNKVDAIVRRAELEGRMETAAVEAEINTVVGKLLGIPAVDVAYPAQRDARLRARYDAIRGVLERNMDLLPLLADPSFEQSTSELTSLISGLFGDGPTGGGRSMNMDVGFGGAGSAGAAIEPRARLLRKASMPGPSGQLEVLLVEGGSDRVVGGIGESGPHRLLITHAADPVDVSMRALAGAATWCGVKLGAKVLAAAGPGDAGRVALTRVEPGARTNHHEVEAALGVWIAAINSLMEGTVEVVVGV